MTLGQHSQLCHSVAVNITPSGLITASNFRDAHLSTTQLSAYIANSLTKMNMTEYSPPYLHTRYLTTAQQSFCEQNPTYSSRLADLRALRNEVEQIRGLIATQEKSTLPTFAERVKTTKRRSREIGEPKVLEEERQALNSLERKMLEWDDELAGLAEALLCKPKVSLGTSA